MMDRYEGNEIKLDYNERPGGIFINRAKQINALLEKLKLNAVSVDNLGKIWKVEEELRKPYKISDEKHDAYTSAKQRLSFMQVNPQIFHQDDTKKRAELEKQKALLAKEIENYEKEFARAEDSKRLEADDERTKLNNELAVLNYKKKKYEDRQKSKTTGCFPCGKKNEKKLESVTAQITAIQNKLADINKSRYDSLAKKRRKLDEMRQERTAIDKALSAYDSQIVTRARRYQNAMNNLEIVVKVRQLEIDEEVDRHYGSLSEHCIHAFLQVFALIKDTVDKANIQVNKNTRDIVDLLNKHVMILDEISEMIYCPEPVVANRTLMTLYRNKLPMLSPEDRDQVLHGKLIQDTLPPALVRTFSVKNFRADAPSLGLFRKSLVDPPPLSASSDAAGSQNENSASSGAANKGDQLKLLHQMSKS